MDNEFKSFFIETKDLIQLYVYKMANEGPVPFASTKDFVQDINRFTRLGIFYSTALGQGHNAHTGLYGPLPIPESTDSEDFKSYQALAFSFYKTDETLKDVRAKGKAYSFIVTLIPDDMIHLFSNKNVISRVFHYKLEKTNKIKEIDNKFLIDLRKELLEDIYKTTEGFH